jgi:phosphatidylglycerophosphate synthase
MVGFVAGVARETGVTTRARTCADTPAAHPGRAGVPGTTTLSGQVTTSENIVSTAPPAVPDRPRAADFLATNRGGGLLSEAVDQPVGARIALAGHRLGLAPSVLTVVNLVIGVGTSVAVVALAGPMRDGRVPALAVGLCALVAWHVAYQFDCADGQLARVTGRTSPVGARLDILCDVAVQIALVCAVSAVAVRYRPATPAWFVAAFAGCWMINLVTSVLATGAQAQSLVTSTSLPVRVVKLVRDYGAMITLMGLAVAFVPGWLVWVMVAFTGVNALFLLASIAAATATTLRPPAQPAATPATTAAAARPADPADPAGATPRPTGPGKRRS